MAQLDLMILWVPILSSKTLPNFDNLDVLVLQNQQLDLTVEVDWAKETVAEQYWDAGPVLDNLWVSVLTLQQLKYLRSSGVGGTVWQQYFIAWMVHWHHILSLSNVLTILSKVTSSDTLLGQSTRSLSTHDPILGDLG